MDTNCFTNLLFSFQHDLSQQPESFCLPASSALPHQLNKIVECAGNLFLQHYQPSSLRLFGLRFLVKAAHKEEPPCFLKLSHHLEVQVRVQGVCVLNVAVTYEVHPVASVPLHRGIVVLCMYKHWDSNVKINSILSHVICTLFIAENSFM